MCVQETRRQVYVYRKGRWGLCLCMLVRGRVLVIKVSENSRKWLREGGRVISRACLRERHLGREYVSMCERPLMDIHRVHVCVCITSGLERERDEYDVTTRDSIPLSVYMQGRRE